MPKGTGGQAQQLDAHLSSLSMNMDCCAQQEKKKDDPKKSFLKEAYEGKPGFFVPNSI